MNELSIIYKNGVDVIDSREVAEAIGKDHRHLIRDIRNYAEIIENSNEPNFGLVDFFVPSTYIDTKGEERHCYLLTEKGCDMVANKMTGEKGVLFTPANDLEIMAYGDFLIDFCQIWEGGVELVLKQQFVKKGGAA